MGYNVHIICTRQTRSARSDVRCSREIGFYTAVIDVKMMMVNVLHSCSSQGLMGILELSDHVFQASIKNAHVCDGIILQRGEITFNVLFLLCDVMVFADSDCPIIKLSPHHFLLAC